MTMLLDDPMGQASTPGFLSGGGEMGALIRSHDWASTTLGSPATWPQSLRTVTRLMLTTNHPMFVFWGPQHICLYNDAYGASIGPEKHPAMLGAPGRQMWGEIWEIIGPQIDLVMMARGATWHEDHLVPIIRHGALEDVYWTYSYSPIDDDSGAGGVGGVLVVCTETTGKVLAERDLREANRALDQANAQQRAQNQRIIRLVEQAPSLIAVLRGPDHVVELANAAALKFFGQRDLLGKPVRSALSDIEGQGFFESLDQVYASGEAFVGRGLPIAIQNDDSGVPEQRFLDFVYQPIVEHDGQVSGIFIDAHDITEHRKLEDQLQESEKRFRILADAMPQLVWTAHADGYIHWYNQGWYQYTGATPEAMAGWGWQSVHDPEVLPSVMARWQASIATGEPFEMTFPLRGSDGAFRPFLTRVIPQKDDQGRVLQWYGTNTDIEELQRAEEKQELLLREMDHRVHNLFAVVGGMVALSARSAATPREMADAIRGRIGALAAAHQLVRPRHVGAAAEGRETNLDDLVRRVLAPHVDPTHAGDAASVLINGPQVVIGEDAVTSFALILYELATNAAKYGAFSTPGGRVGIAWSMDDDKLQMTWREQGGPAVKAPPEHEGFGSLLTRRSVQGQLGGQLTYDWAPEGLVVHLSAAADRLSV